MPMSVTVSSSASPRLHAAGELFLALPAAVGVAAAVGAALGLAGTFALEVMAVYAGVSLVILLHAPALAAERGGPGLGTPNRITLARLLLVLPLVLFPLHPEALGVAGRWWAVGLGTAALSLDGVDGWLARRTGSGTAFGARFDMETDAGLILLLSILVWRSGQAPAWTLLLGAMRYLFVAAGWILPALRAPLFPSLRRKVVCVVQGVALLVALGPVIPSSLATAAVGTALVLLAWSFAVDTRWLLDGARRSR
ncbi:MAG TPA: CDP-alcohol phosphatidyltransferase family protein [Longimicrobiales bacterium]|nr:CDP-alcohol phosphatidyltransferase family protein [Longimicrobiales bacterium]